MFDFNYIKNKQKTKIIATIGPSINSENIIKKLFYLGMTTIRFNFSHGNYKEQEKKINWIKNVIKKINKPISILLDTKGPEIRILKIKDNGQNIKKNDKIIIYTFFVFSLLKKKKCRKNEIVISYNYNLYLKYGDKIFIDDGKLILFVYKIENNIIYARALNDHFISLNKKINFPEINLSLPFLSEKDIDDISFGIKNKFDYIAVSFVNNCNDLKKIRKIIDDKNKESNIQIISKIESKNAINNIDEIINYSDGIMIARGDLALEIPYYDIPYWEKKIIKKCRDSFKPVIVATQMLESMIENVFPTRAEITDIYFAILLGTDATMLSAETAIGKNPLVTLNTMSEINIRAEKEFYNLNSFFYLNKKKYYDFFLKKNIKNFYFRLSYKLWKKCKNNIFKYIIVFTNKKNFLKILSNFRINSIILGVSSKNELYTYFGIWNSIFMNKVSENFINNIDKNKILYIAKKWKIKNNTKILYIFKKKIKEFLIE